MHPNLFVIGAMKAGTSSLHEYLHQHPDIFMSRMKEPQYFAPHATRWGQKWGQGNPYPEPGIDWYLRLFKEAGDVAYAGESSVSYAARPWVTDCEQRIYEFNPDARILYLMRDPVERAISHYWYFVADGREDRGMLEALKKKPEYVERSDYAMQLAPYLKRFGPEQVYTLTLEELDQDPDGTFRRLFAWLGIREDATIETGKKFNQGRPELRQTRRGLVPVDTLLKHWRWQQVEKYLPAKLRDSLRRWPYRRVVRSEVEDRRAVEYLRERLAPTVAALRSLVNVPTHLWRATLPGRSTPTDESTPEATKETAPSA